MQVAIVIPARHASTRFPGKPLVALRGATGRARSLIERSVTAGRQACAALGPGTALLVATDDARIADETRRIGAEVVMTSSGCRNGTERVAEAVANAGLAADIVVNLQGDAPLTPPGFVTALVEFLHGNPAAQMATPVLRCSPEALARFRADRAAGRVGATTVVTNRLGQALYFSKEVIPFTDGRPMVAGQVPVFHHVGLYAFRPPALAAYTGWEPGMLETLEGLEQLRFLENGHPVHAVEVRADEGAVFWELNNPEDVPRIEAALAQMGIE